MARGHTLDESNANSWAENRLSYSGNLLVENRNGLIVDAEVFQANGTAERDAALIMMERLPGTQPLTVGVDKGFDTFGFVEWRGWDQKTEIPLPLDLLRRARDKYRKVLEHVYEKRIRVCAGPGEQCQLSTGKPRTEPHRDRRLIASD